MIDHHCPNCDQLIRSADHLAGFSILCPHCRGVKVRVPEQSTARPTPAQPTETADRATPAPAAIVPRYDEPAEHPPPRSVRRCFVCGELAEADTVYLRVN